MSVVNNILSRFGYVTEKDFTVRLQEAVKAEVDKKLPQWLGESADAAKFDMPDPAIFANQADMYRLSPLLGTAVDMLANDIGTAKLNVKRRVGEETREIKNHPYEVLLRNPNPADSGLELAQYTVSNYLLNGNAVRWLNRAFPNDPPSEIWTIPFSAIEVVPDEKMYISHYLMHPGAGKPPIRLETWEIVHYKTYNPNNRFVGMSKLESLAMTLTGDLAMRKTNTVAYAEYGGAPQSILAFKEFPATETWQDIKSEVRNAAKRNEMMMLRGVGDGVTWMQRALSSKDMDFIAGLKQNMEDVFNRMCPGLLNILSEGATYSNADAARSTYSEKTLYPVMEALAQKDTCDILPSYGRGLMCEYEDPRYKDRAIVLAERAADEKIMTLGEIRKEYKQLDPLGDERDGLLITQINAQTGKPEPVQQPVTQPAPIVDTTGDTTEPMEAQPEPADPKLDAQKADLMRWKRYALRTFGKAAKPFEGVNIPDELAQRVNEKLAACKSAGEVADVFEEAKPDSRDSIRYLAMVIEKAVAMKGGEGSGNFNHAGRPGEVGGSSDGGIDMTAGVWRNGVRLQNADGSWRLNEKEINIGAETIFKEQTKKQHDKMMKLKSVTSLSDEQKAFLDVPGNDKLEFVTAWRYGNIPEGGRSYNFRESIFEDGVSVMEASNGSRTYDVMLSLSKEGKGVKIIYVSGFINPNSKGTDGEPLLLKVKELK